MFRILISLLLLTLTFPAYGEYAKPEMTELHRAVFYGKTDVVEFYAQNGTDLNALASNKVTPLHLAAFRGKVESVKVLLKYGADKNLRNVQGQTALDISKSKGFKEIITLLK